MSSLDTSPPETRAFGERQGAVRYADALREHWVMILGLVLTALIVAVVYSTTAHKRYQAEADILVTPISSSDDTYTGIRGVLQDTTGQSNAVLTVARLITTPQLADSVKSRYGFKASRDALLRKITVSPASQSNIIAVTATAGSARGAALYANAFANRVVAQLNSQFQGGLSSQILRLTALLRAIPPSQAASPEAVSLAQRLSALRAVRGSGNPTVQVVSSAVPPTKPSWPRPVLAVGIALVASALLGVGLALALELLNPRLKREEDLILGHRLPILARIPRMKQSAVTAFFTGTAPLPPDVREAYRIMRASLAVAGRDDGFPRSILITSAIPGEGKTMTAVNLAMSLADGGRRVVLVDGDLRRPMVATVFGLSPGRHGLAAVLLGEVGVEDALLSAPGHNDRLKLLLASPEHAHVVDLLDPRRVQRVLDELRAYADVVVVDSPPVTVVADALNLADAVETVIVSVNLGRTRRDKLTELRRMLAQRGVAPAGFVVTTRSRSRKDEYYYGSDARPTPTRDGAPPQQQQQRRVRQKPKQTQRPRNTVEPRH
ncbi:MAG TPA: polysaccharide biosynthesis tyrosine autokinase [Gaiellaceae bacterium]|jgi:capsular exopolysaccharide synthesis family protein|nr:polysaccharide biosynthesis tyrosine autokinase [Gaiellaceae bacterium]